MGEKDLQNCRTRSTQHSYEFEMPIVKELPGRATHAVTERRQTTSAQSGAMVLDTNSADRPSAANHGPPPRS